MLPMAREELVAGGPKDFMTVRHLKISGSNRAIGRKLAQVAKERHRVQAEKPNDHVMTAARVAYYQTHYPAHFERMKGVADAFGVALGGGHELGDLTYNFNVRPGCSTVYYPGSHSANGHALLSRNYDFTTASAPVMFGLPDFPGSKAITAEPYVIEVYPDRGIPSLYICAYDLLGGCIDGMNAEGLTIALLADDESSAKYQVEPTRGNQAGFNEIQITRFVLDTCSCVDDAKQALLQAKQYYSFVPCHYIIGDRHGRSFVFEFSPWHNKEHITDGGGKPQAVTNHPVYRYKQLSEMPLETHPGSSYVRMRKLTERLSAKPKFSIDEVKDNNLCVRADAPSPPGRPPGRTLWHSLYDLEALTMEVDFYLGESAEGQRRCGYKKFRLERG